MIALRKKTCPLTKRCIQRPSGVAELDRSPEMMKLPVALIAVGLVMTGCVSPHPTGNPTKPAHRDDRILLLDNSGGYSHPGRRIELLEGANVIETRYSDVIGDQTVRRGRYVLNRDVLDLRFGDRGNQQLRRVRYGNEIYWVYPNEVEKIALPEGTWLRQTSLKQQGEQDRGANALPRAAHD